MNSFKIVDFNVLPFEDTNLNLVTLVVLSALFVAASLLPPGRTRQRLRPLFQLVGAFVFVFVVYSCLGVLGMIQNFTTGLSLILDGWDYAWALFLMGVSVVIICFSLILGPVFCGWICPTGALQEWASFAYGLLKAVVRKVFTGRWEFSRPRLHRRSRWENLAGVAAASAVYAAGIALLFFLETRYRRTLISEQSSIFWVGALLVVLFIVSLWPGDVDRRLRPLRFFSFAVLLLIALSEMRTTSPVHFLYSRVEDPASAVSTVVIAFTALALPRAWCRYMCPWGFVVNACYRCSPRRLKRDARLCTGCGTCEAVCERRAITVRRIVPVLLRVRGLLPRRCAYRGGYLEGGRGVTLRILLVLAVLLAAARGGEVTAGWPVPRGTPAGTASYIAPTGRKEFMGVYDYVPAWEYDLSPYPMHYRSGLAVWSAPALCRVNGKILVYAGSYDRRLYALDALTGDEVWKATLGGGVYNAPVVGGRDGWMCVYAVSLDRTAYAFDAETGEKIWNFETRPYSPTLGRVSVTAPCLSPDGSILFFGTWWIDRAVAGHVQEAFLWAVDARTGKAVWKKKVGRQRLSSPLAVEVEGDVYVYIAGDDGRIQCFRASEGEQVWRFVTADRVRSSPCYARTAAGPTIFIGSQYNYLYALDALTGRERWKFLAGDWIDSTPAVARVGDRMYVFFGSYDYRVYCVDALTGKLAWRYRTADAVSSSPALLQFEGKTYVLISSLDNWLYCLEMLPAGDVRLEQKWHIGKMIWSGVKRGENTWGSPVVLNDRRLSMVFYGSYDRKLYAHSIFAPMVTPECLREGERKVLWIIFWTAAAAALCTVILILKGEGEG